MSFHDISLILECKCIFPSWRLSCSTWSCQWRWAAASPLLSLGKGWMWGTDRGKNRMSDGEQGDGGGELSGRSRGTLSKQSLWVMGGRKCGRRSRWVCPAPLHKGPAQLPRPLELFRSLLLSVISKLCIHRLSSDASFFICLFFFFLITFGVCSRQTSSNKYSSFSVLIPVSRPWVLAAAFSRLPWCQRWTLTVCGSLFMDISSFWWFAGTILGSGLSWMRLSPCKGEFRWGLSINESERSTDWPDVLGVVFKTERRRRWGGKLADRPLRPSVRKRGAGRRSTLWRFPQSSLVLMISLAMIPSPAGVFSMMESGGGARSVSSTLKDLVHTAD